MSELEKNLGYDFKKKELLSQALTHKSAYYESKIEVGGHNEKFEFLGDAVLDLVLSELLMELFPEDGEGNLSKKRASLVNEGVLCQIAKALDLSKHLHLGKGEQMTGGEKKPRLLASAYEALIGAVFIDGGYDTAKAFLRSTFEPIIRELNPQDDFSTDYKTKLQEEVQSVLKEAPSYVLVSESGPAHDRLFEVEVRIRNRPLASASGKSKKAAEQEAARQSLEIWKKAKESLT
jgi:ribonuclease-3